MRFMLGNFFEVLLLLCRVIDDGLLSFELDVAESLVHVCVGAIDVCVLGLHVQAFTPEIVRLVVSYALEYCRCTGVLLDLVAAIGNTGVLEVLQLGPCATPSDAGSRNEPGKHHKSPNHYNKRLRDRERGKKNIFVCGFLRSGTRGLYSAPCSSGDRIFTTNFLFILITEDQVLYCKAFFILQCVRLLVSCNINFGLGPLAGRNLALEQNVNLTVGTALHLRQEKVCQHEAEETRTTPDVTALATEVGLLLYVSNSNDCRSRKSYIRVKHVAREENAGNVYHVVGSATNTSS
jgi:hypothetical protein